MHYLLFLTQLCWIDILFNSLMQKIIKYFIALVISFIPWELHKCHQLIKHHTEIIISQNNYFIKGMGYKVKKESGIKHYLTITP